MKAAITTAASVIAAVLATPSPAANKPPKIISGTWHYNHHADFFEQKTSAYASATSQSKDGSSLVVSCDDGKENSDGFSLLLFGLPKIKADTDPLKTKRVIVLLKGRGYPSAWLDGDVALDGMVFVTGQPQASASLAAKAVAHNRLIGIRIKLDDKQHLDEYYAFEQMPSKVAGVFAYFCGAKD